MKSRLLVLFLLMGSAHADYFSDFSNPQAESTEARQEVITDVVYGTPYYDVTTENSFVPTYTDFEDQFSKTLHHHWETGLLSNDGEEGSWNGNVNYQRLLTAIASGLQADFNAIERAPDATQKFQSPQGMYTRTITGVPSALIAIPSNPALNTPEAAANIIENYLMSICRDVNFWDYGTGSVSDEDTINTGSKTNHAAAILSALSAYTGPNTEGTVSAEHQLFRGTSAGDLVGPYLSQFWFRSTSFVSNGAVFTPQVGKASVREFGASWSDFIHIQNGTIPKTYDVCDTDSFATTRYIQTGRDLATVVHKDNPGEFFLFVTNVLLQNGFAYSTALPYYNSSMPNESAFVDFAAVDICNLLGQAASESLKHAWAHKWRGDRRLRPEAMAGHVHRAKVTTTNPLGLDESIFATYDDINLLQWVYDYNYNQVNLPHPRYSGTETETYLLSQVYPEGSPVHPSYPSGHAVIAGACATILKAFFTNSTFINDIFVPVIVNDSNDLINITDSGILSTMTLAGELDKFASNIANARNFAGVHYRSDGDQGLLLGEQVGLGLLQAFAHTYHESGFTGFVLTLRNGVTVQVTPTEIVPVPV